MRAVETRPVSSRRRAASPPPDRPGPARRPGARARRLRPLAPYALLAPALLVLAAILGFPLYRLVSLSFQQYGLKELFAGKGTFIGLRNYQDILTDSFFWTVVVRTVLFAAVCVGLTMVLGHPGGPAAAQPGPAHAGGGDGRAGGRLGDADPDRHLHLAVDVRLRVRGGELAADPARGRRASSSTTGSTSRSRGSR